jgi:hypothetical protein
MEADLTDPYALSGTDDCPQVEPAASIWTDHWQLKIPTAAEVLAELGSIAPYPVPGSQTEKQEVAELETMAQERNLDLTKVGVPVKPLSRFLSDPMFFDPPPARAVLPLRSPSSGVIKTGTDLCSLFEGETPGLWYRHVLDVLFDPGLTRGFCQSLSPPRHGLVWACLDAAIYSALATAWHIKWKGGAGVGRRYRPHEANGNLRITFDYQIEPKKKGESLHRDKFIKSDPNIHLPTDSPGTPRHPAYPSGHSCYAGAASALLSCLLPHDEKGNDLTNDWDLLAHNHGEARLWGGVHWRTDHDLGMRVGQAVAALIIEQLDTSGIERMPTPMIPPPPLGQEGSPAPRQNFCEGLLPDKPHLTTFVQFR